MRDNADSGIKQALIAAAICVVLASCAEPVQPALRQITAHEIAWCRKHVARNNVSACVHDVSQQQDQPEQLSSLATPPTRCITQQYGTWYSIPCPP